MAGSFLRRLAPGLAVAGAACALVFGFDRALRPASAAPATDAGSAGDAGSGGAGSAGSGGTESSCTEHTGDTVQTEWGPVQVVASVGADGRVCSAEAVVWPSGDGRSVMINDYAIPLLNEAATSQGVAFDAVSGATVTSEGYRGSLQAILDSL